MGAKTWMIVHAEQDARASLASHPVLDEAATASWVSSLFPATKFTISGRGDLSYTHPPQGQLFAGRFPGVHIVACRDFAQDYPSRIPSRYIARHGRTYLHAMHSVVDWFGFAAWRDGELLRSLSLSPDSGILEDMGSRLPFEHPFWAGKHPPVDPVEKPSGYPFPFHPLELGEAALRELFGYQLEGDVDSGLLEPESIPLLHFTCAKPWWKFW